MSTTKKSNARKSTKSTVTEGAKDWTYLLEKDPSNLHGTFAQWISAELGIEVPAEHVQYVLAMHHTFQKGERNKSRDDYRPLDGSIVEQRSVHMVQAHEDARRIRAEREAAQAAAKAKRAAARKGGKKATSKK